MTNADLVGTWRLVSFESRTASGEIRHPLGPRPAGQLMYDATGIMSAQLMDAERPPFASGDLQAGCDAEVRKAFAGCVAYYGTYTLDLDRGIVIHIRPVSRL